MHTNEEQGTIYCITTNKEILCIAVQINYNKTKNELLVTMFKHIYGGGWLHLYSFNNLSAGAVE